VRNQIFISYSHKDVRHLKELRLHLAPYEREYDISVWDDQKIEYGSAWPSEIEEAIARAKVAVLLVTANLLGSRFVIQSELPAILEHVENGGLKIVWVLVSTCAYETTAMARYQAANDVANPVDILPPAKRQAAWTNIARKIVDSCEAFSPQEPRAAATERKTVLLAQVTDDLEDEAAQVRSYLAQYKEEIGLLPAGFYPQGGEAFKSAFDRDLAHANLFVQLLGPRAGRVPPDLPKGYTRWQYERAKSEFHRIQVMQWRHPDLDPRVISDSAYKDVITAETVVVAGLETFKRQILDWARRRPSKPPQIRPSSVFINADDKDLGIAKEVQRECLANALTAILPMTGPSSEAIRNDLTANLIECDVLVFVYGDTTLDWIRSQLRFFNKVMPKRESPPRLLAICSGPPPKPDIGISFPNARLIECPEGWNMDGIRRLFAELNA
jgi:TIR domain